MAKHRRRRKLSMTKAAKASRKYRRKVRRRIGVVRVWRSSKAKRSRLARLGGGAYAAHMRKRGRILRRHRRRLRRHRR